LTHLVYDEVANANGNGILIALKAILDEQRNQTSYLKSIYGSMWGSTFGVLLSGEIDAVPIVADLGVKIISLPIQAVTDDADSEFRVRKASEPSEDPCGSCDD